MAEEIPLDMIELYSGREQRGVFLGGSGGALGENMVGRDSSTAQPPLQLLPQPQPQPPTTTPDWSLYSDTDLPRVPADNLPVSSTLGSATLPVFHPRESHNLHGVVKFARYRDSPDDVEAELVHIPPAPRFPRLRLKARNRFCLLFKYFCMMILAIIVAIGLLFVGWMWYQWKAEGYTQVPWVPDAETVAFSQGKLPAPIEQSNISDYQLPLRTKGRHIVDQTDRRFKLSSINYYGASDEFFVAGGLDVQHRSVIAQSIRKLGFNSVRLPYADELVYKNPVVDAKKVSANPDLIGLKALDVLEAVTTALTDAGLAVILNNHITSAQWCCGADPCDAGWANDHLGPICRVKQTEEQWIQNWEIVMERFLHNPYVIGADLRNEVRGLWGTMPWRKWAAAAEKCGNRLLKMNKDWLIIVEGTESANDVSGAKKRPVVLDVDNRLVYSAHIYSWSGWGSVGGRFSRRSYASFVNTMRHNWGYLLESDTAPVWVGEFGAPSFPHYGHIKYWNNMFRYLKAVDADFGYWALNPRKPDGIKKEGYSVLKDDWMTPALDYRMKSMTELMRQGYEVEE